MAMLISMLTFIKKIGAVPRNKPIVVKPKAKPGVLFNTDTSIAKVMDMVIENSMTPIKEIIMMLSPKQRNGIARMVDNTATF